MAFNNEKKKNIKDLDNVFQIIEKREGTQETEEEKEIREQKSKEMKKIRFILIGILIILILMTGIYVAYNIYESANEDFMLLRASYRHELTLRNVDDTLLKNYLQPGKKTLITIWASWCSHCQSEAEDLNKFINYYKDANIIVVSHDKNVETLNKYFELHNDYKWFVIYDPNKLIRSSIDAKATSLPITYLLNDKGEIIGKKVGESTFDDFINLYNQKEQTENKE